MLAFLSCPVKLVSLALIVGGVVLKFFANTLVSLLGDFGAVTDVTKLDLGIPEMADVKELPFLDDVGLFFIIFGCILFVISFCACCGACYQWRPLLIVVRTRPTTVNVLLHYTRRASLLTDNYLKQSKIMWRKAYTIKISEFTILL